MNIETPGTFARRRVEEEAKRIFSLAGKRKTGKLETGTVIMSFLYKDGVMIAADRQVSGWTKIARTNFPKITKISSYSAISFCGSVVMAQAVAKIYADILASIKFRIDEDVSIPGQIKILEGMMQQLGILFDFDIGAMFHFIGIDPKTGKAYLLEFCDDGAALKPDCTVLADGSGGTEARTTLKNFFEANDFKKLEFEEAAKLAIKTVRISAEADAGVGDPRLQSATLAIINAKTGFSFVDQQKVKSLIAEVCK